MNVEEFRDYCLSLPDVTEGTPFERFSRGRFTILVFYVSGHMFCYFNIDDFSEITVKCRPDEIAELKEQYEAVGEPFNGNKRVKGKRYKRYEVNTNGLIVEEAFMEMGRQYNAAVWDQFDIMGGLKSMQDWEKAGLAKKDKVHFTNEGYKLLGDLLYNALITKYIEHVRLNTKR